MDEAVEINYQEPKPEPKEDEKPQEVELTVAPETPRQEHQDAEEIVIDMEEDTAVSEQPKTPETNTGTQRSRLSWFRNR